MDWKYEEVDEFEGCPQAEAKDQTAYRLVKSMTPDQTDFVPRFVELGMPPTNCGNVGLSFHTTFGKCRKKRKKIQKLHERANRSVEVPEFIATVDLIGSEGESTEPSTGGHFNFYEYEGTDLVDRVTEVKSAA